ncbi:hypothetical protein K435DRAFT_777192 [Dendrothele bispora CBS 962.96]|uniref:Transmembrane protein n=1 Tax=Dendrothele bispora (strain CBS 962.96) TaxID=1314807 RepID=A0A4V6T5I1_DENBC|nr:hypothetical protein K435DRAFT_777192 [Dendrothele bispora CBS 962.96]
MVAFRAFSLVAALACAAFSFAAPVTPAYNALEARCGCSPLPAVIATLETSVTPLVYELHYMTKDNCTAAAVTPIVADIKVAVNVAIADVKVLAGVGIETVLATSTGVLAVVDVAKIVAGVICLIFNAVGYILTIVVAAERDAVCALLAEVIVLVGTLLQLILSLVGGLLVCLLPLITNVLYVAVRLNVAGVFAFLGISL